MPPFHLVRAAIYAPLILIFVFGSYVFPERNRRDDHYATEDSRD